MRWIIGAFFVVAFASLAGTGQEVARRRAPRRPIHRRAYRR